MTAQRESVELHVQIFSQKSFSREKKKFEFRNKIERERKANFAENNNER